MKRKNGYLFFIVFLFFCNLLIADGAIVPVAVINLEVKDEAGYFIDDTGNEEEGFDNLSCQVWLNDGYGAAVGFSDVNVEYLELFSTIPSPHYFGIIVVQTSSLYPSSNPGDILKIWVQYNPTGENPNQEGMIEIPLTDESMIELTANEALYLTSEIITEDYGEEDLTGTYQYNTSRGIDDVCEVTLTLPDGSEGDITVGLLSQKPGSVPLHGINFGFYFDKKGLTTLGSGNISVTIDWNSNIGLTGTTESNQGMYISEDGIYWVNTKNVTYSGLSVYGTTLPDFSEGFTSSSGSMTFDINHIPHSVVFGDGDGSYTETTPPQPVGLTAVINGSNLDLTWNKSPQPGVTYDVQEYVGNAWTNLDVSGSIGGTTQKTYSAPGITTDSKFYRAKVSNNSGQISYSQPLGYVKYTLAASGWNMVGYTMGENGTTVDNLYSNISNVESGGVKIWNKDTQAWVTYNDGSTKGLQKGDVFLVNVSSGSTWYSTGSAYSSDGPYSYTFKYSGKGYNLIILPFDKAGITTAAALYDDIFGSSSHTSYNRTISYFDQASGKFLTFEDGPIPSGFDAQVKVGTPFMIHVGSADNNSTWPE